MHPKKLSKTVSETGAKWSGFGEVSETWGLAPLYQVIHFFGCCLDQTRKALMISAFEAVGQLFLGPQLGIKPMNSPFEARLRPLS